MNSSLTLQLDVTPEQAERLRALQAAFAEVCNALAPVVQDKRCWHRVTLHHLTYHALRERFPQMGSQMVCNAIYSVCRSSRMVYQHPASPFNLQKRPGAPLPRLQFTDSTPVYFDRHTLSLKDGKLSMYTLDGRMRFHLNLNPADQARFAEERLREIILARSPQGFQLSFTFQSAEDVAVESLEASAELPEYLLVLATNNELAENESLPTS